MSVSMSMFLMSRCLASSYKLETGIVSPELSRAVYYGAGSRLVIELRS
jgi:hypothetical protein